jgi:hypothetical protein
MRWSWWMTDRPTRPVSRRRREIWPISRSKTGTRSTSSLLFDVYERFRCEAIIELDLGERIHRNRPLHELRSHSRAVLDAVFTRALPGQPLSQMVP